MLVCDGRIKDSREREFFNIKKSLFSGATVSQIDLSASASAYLEKSAQDSMLEIENLEVSIRSYNCIKKSGAKTVLDLLLMGKKKFLGIKGAGKSVIKEIEEVLFELSFSWPNEGFCWNEKDVNEARTFRALVGATNDVVFQEAKRKVAFCVHEEVMRERISLINVN